MSLRFASIPVCQSKQYFLPGESKGCFVFPRSLMRAIFYNIRGDFMSKTIAVLSDTHGLLRPEVLDRIAGCDVIIHGGDINKPAILDELKQLAPLYVVRGNNDKEWAEGMPETLTFQIEDVHFFTVHNKKFVPKDLPGIDIVVFGHSHKYFEETIDSRLWLNPGSCGKRRFDQEITFAIMTIDGKAVQVEKVVIPHPKK